MNNYSEEFAAGVANIKQQTIIEAIADRFIDALDASARNTLPIVFDIVSDGVGMGLYQAKIADIFQMTRLEQLLNMMETNNIEPSQQLRKTWLSRKNSAINISHTALKAALSNCYHCFGDASVANLFNIVYTAMDDVMDGLCETNTNNSAIFSEFSEFCDVADSLVAISDITQ